MHTVDTNFAIAAVQRSAGSYALQPYYKRQPHPLCRLAVLFHHNPPSYLQYDRPPPRAHLLYPPPTSAIFPNHKALQHLGRESGAISLRLL